MNIRWLYWSVYFLMGAAFLIALFNPTIDGLLTTALIALSVFLLLTGASLLEENDD